MADFSSIIRSFAYDRIRLENRARGIGVDSTDSKRPRVNLLEDSENGSNSFGYVLLSHK